MLLVGRTDLRVTHQLGDAGERIHLRVEGLPGSRRKTAGGNGRALSRDLGGVRLRRFRLEGMSADEVFQSGLRQLDDLTFGLGEEIVQELLVRLGRLLPRHDGLTEVLNALRNLSRHRSTQVDLLNPAA